MVFKNGQRFEVELSTSFENKDTLVFLANRDITGCIDNKTHGKKIPGQKTP